MMRARITDCDEFSVCIDTVQLARCCRHCVLSLLCLSGKRHEHSYICSQCEAIWVDDLMALVDCDAFEMEVGHQILPGCPACEPFENAPQNITKVVGYCSEEYKILKDGDDRAVDEK